MEKNETMVILDHYKSLDRKQRAAFKKDVLKLTGIKYASFYNKLHGRGKFRKSELFVINTIISEQHAAQN